MQKLTAYRIAMISDCVKAQSSRPLLAKNPDKSMKSAPKKYEYAVKDKLAGYFFKTGAWNCQVWFKKKMCKVINITIQKEKAN